MRKSKKKYEPIINPYELDEYGLGSWLKKNAGLIGTTVGALGAIALTGGLAAPAVAPGLAAAGGTAAATGAAAGGLGSTLGAIGLGTSIGGQVGGSVQQNAMQKEANATQQSLLNSQNQLERTTALNDKLRNNQVQNTPLYMCGGKMKKYGGGGELNNTNVPTPPTPNLATQFGLDTTLYDTFTPARKYLAKFTDINDPKLYEGLNDPDALGSYTSLFQEMGEKGVPYRTSFINNWNKMYGKDKGFFYDPNNLKGLGLPIDATNPKYKTLYDTYYPQTNTQSTQPASYNLRSSDGTELVGTKVTPTFANGGIINYTGQTHDGPDNGIPVDAQGNPSIVSKQKPVALTENKEVTWLTPEGESYVFSHKLGYSDKANKLINKYKKRLGGKLDGVDELSWKGLNNDLSKLSSQQEDFRQGLDANMESITYGEGGKIHIKPENKGKFTQWAKSHNMSVQEAAKHVMAHKDNYSSTIIKRANFAKNFAHENGGMIQYDNPPINISPFMTLLENNYSATKDIASGLGDVTSSGMAETLVPFRGNVSPLGMIGSAVGNAILMSGESPANVRLPRTQAEEVSYAQERANARENYLNARANLMNKLKSSGLSPAQYAQATMSGTADLNTLANQSIGASLMNEANTNVGIRNQVAQQNAQIAAQEMMANAQAQQESDYRKQQYLSNILQAPINYLAEKQGAAQLYDMANAEGKVGIYQDPKTTLAQKILGLQRYNIKPRK